MQKKFINALGLMSGTSLDGLDLCLARFELNNLSNFEILKTQDLAFPDGLLTQLKKAHLLSGLELAHLSNQFAQFTANAINNFKTESDSIDLVASHGHTVFHDPEKGLTTQIGNGAIIYAKTGIKTVCDFRTVDVALNGQGAPLVPIGDLLLFSNYDACLNLGGIANISYKKNDGIIAQDLCFANMLLNHITQKYFNSPYDSGGKLSSKGEINHALLRDMEHVNSAFKNKSLGREDFEDGFYELLKKNIQPLDLLRTSIEYMAKTISANINSNSPKSILVSGGGAHNHYLIELLRQKSNPEVIVPSPELINFKEALVFAFLGVKRILNQVNSLKNVTGAFKDNVGGCIYG